MTEYLATKRPKDYFFEKDISLGFFAFPIESSDGTNTDFASESLNISQQGDLKIINLPLKKTFLLVSFLFL